MHHVPHYTSERIAAVLTRDAADRAGQASTLLHVEHEARGEAPRVAHWVTFHYADRPPVSFGPRG